MRQNFKLYILKTLQSQQECKNSDIYSNNDNSKYKIYIASFAVLERQSTVSSFKQLLVFCLNVI